MNPIVPHDKAPPQCRGLKGSRFSKIVLSAAILLLFAVLFVAPVSAADEYLTFSSENGVEFTLKTANDGKNWDGTLSYSTNTVEWKEWNGEQISSSANGKLYLRGEGNTVITGEQAWNDNPKKSFVLASATGAELKISCTGNIETLLDWRKAALGENPAMGEYCFKYLFKDWTVLVEAPELPATVLSKGCYDSMFEGCTSLTTAPVLPATTLADDCYCGMFGGSGLVTAPALPAETLADYCYYAMFQNCNSLVIAPALPATTLADYCYANMFRSCSSLTTAPALPATTLANKCYTDMFRSCSSLTTAPSLPATTLEEQCYCRMFYDCDALTVVPELPATMLAKECYHQMFTNCGNIKLDTENTDGDKADWSIPLEAEVSTEALSSWKQEMFGSTGGTFQGEPNVGTVYYQSAYIISFEGDGYTIENKPSYLPKNKEDVTITFSIVPDICKKVGEVKVTTSTGTLTTHGDDSYTLSAVTSDITITVETTDDHIYSEPTYEWSADNTTCTAKRVDACGTKNEEETATADKEIIQSPTCENDELTTYTSTFANTAFETQIKEKVKTKDKLGHTYGDLVPKVEPTTSATGFEAHYFCDVCDTYFTADRTETTYDALVIPKLPVEDPPQDEPKEDDKPQDEKTEGNNTPQGSTIWSQPSTPYSISTVTITNGGDAYFNDAVFYCVTMPAGFSGDVILTSPYDGEKPAGVDTISIVDITITGEMEGTATIKFKLPLDDIQAKGYEPADVCLYHYTSGAWVKLDTTYEIIDGIAYYEAVTDSFSPFAVVFENGSAKPVEVPTAQPTETEVESTLSILAVLGGLGAVAILRRR